MSFGLEPYLIKINKLEKKLHKLDDKLESIKKVVGDPRLYLEETTVFALPLATMTDKYNALWRLCEINRKQFLKIINILEDPSCSEKETTK